MSEHSELISVCNYVRLKYPRIIFFCDIYDKLSFTNRMRYKALRSGSNPDLFIALPNKNYNGLFIEMKKTGTKLFNKQNNYASEHLQNQAFVIDRLNSMNYFATFAIGTEHAITIIDKYVHNQL